MILYKYKSLAPFEHLVDIVVNNRMYAAPFLTLGDPMEGSYRRWSKLRGSTVVRRLTEEDTNYRILSLSLTWNNTLMWSHYADKHRGVVIGVRLPVGGPEANPVEYKSRLVFSPTSTVPEQARRLLSRKHTAWKDEEEYRVITDKEFVEVELVEIIIGVEATIAMGNLIVELVESTGSLDREKVVWMDTALLDVNT